MSIQKELEKEGIEVIGKLDSLITNDIIKDISRRIIETFPDFEFTNKELCEKLSKLTMYRAKMQEGMAEANYFYKNTSIYFNEHIEYEDLSEFDSRQFADSEYPPAGILPVKYPHHRFPAARVDMP